MGLVSIDASSEFFGLLTRILCVFLRVLEDITVFVESFKEVSEMEFNGDALLRYFRAAYSSSA